MTARQFDAIVIGAGFGGIGAALTLAERGARVALLETLRYPGGCASTFTRKGLQFESGATLFSGFGPGHLMRTWIDRHHLDVTIDFPDPAIELRAGTLSLSLGRNRDRLVEQLCASAPELRPKLMAWFEDQRVVADMLWALFDQPELLPPFGGSNLLYHLRRSPRYLKLLPLMGQPLGSWVRRRGLAHLDSLRIYLDALCQITVQTSAGRAEAPFALAAIDYLFRGTGHVRGGIGQLASGLTSAVSNLGGEVALTKKAKRLEHRAGQWRISTNKATFRAPIVIANVLPQSLLTLGHNIDATIDTSVLGELSTQVETGWGAAMLYMVVNGTKLPSHAHHLQLIDDPAAELSMGNHLFCSVSDARETHRARAGERTVTASTHVDMAMLQGRGPEVPGALIDDVHRRMRQTLRRRAPELAESTSFEMTASPRTFERFTSRPGGYVGGIPRNAGWHNYRRLGPLAVGPGLYLVGDTTFPGQSTLATAIGGVRTADMALGK